MARFMNLATCGVCDTPVRTKFRAVNLTYFPILLALLCLPHRSDAYSAHVADMCDNGAVETAAHLLFQDGEERYFISNGHNYWFLNVTTETPDVQSAYKIPYEFRPDVAILKDTRNCLSGNLSLLLIQMKSVAESSEAEWHTLEMKIGNWSDNETGPVFWSEVKKIAHCDLEAQVCTTTDNYFATMSFDFKIKLSSAFGTIGKTAYFIQGQNMFKVIYKNQCITNPYKEVIAYSAINLGTVTTAALSTHNDNSSVVLFDNDVHITLNNINIDDLTFDDQKIDAAKWQENTNYFFKQCPLVDSAFSFLLMDVFSNSKKHFMKKQIILITSAIVLLCIILLVLAVIVFNIIRRPKNGKRKNSSNNEANEEQLIEQRNVVQIKGNTENGEQQKTLLQTSC